MHTRDYFPIGSGYIGNRLSKACRSRTLRPLAIWDWSIGEDVKYLLIDSHYVVREGLQQILGEAYPGSAFTLAASHGDAVGRFSDVRPHLTIVEITLSGGTISLSALREIKQIDPKARILVFSVRGDTMYVSAAMAAGASGYVVKSATPAQILAAVRAVLSGRTYVHGIVDGHYTGCKPKEFTPREAEVFRLLSEGLTVGQIATGMGLAYKTIANACLKMREKLGVERTSDLVLCAIQGLSTELVTAPDTPPDDVPPESGASGKTTA